MLTGRRLKWWAGLGLGLGQMSKMTFSRFLSSRKSHFPVFNQISFRFLSQKIPSLRINMSAPPQAASGFVLKLHAMVSSAPAEIVDVSFGRIWRTFWNGLEYRDDSEPLYCVCLTLLERLSPPTTVTSSIYRIISTHNNNNIYKKREHTRTILLLSTSLVDFPGGKESNIIILL